MEGYINGFGDGLKLDEMKRRYKFVI